MDSEDRNHLDERYMYQEGKYWATCSLLGAVIRAVGINHQDLRKCIEEARNGYPVSKNPDGAVGKGFNEAVGNILGDNQEWKGSVRNTFSELQGRLHFINQALSVITIGLQGVDQNAISAIREALSSKTLTPSIPEDLEDVEGFETFKAGFTKQRQYLLSFLESVSVE